MSLLLDAGAFIAYERGSRVVQAFLERAQRTGEDVRTTTAVVAQVWRDDPRQARLHMLLRGVREQDLTAERARNVGRLLRSTQTVDVVDGSLIEMANDGDEILTSDPDDLSALAQAARRTILITRIR